MLASILYVVFELFCDSMDYSPPGSFVHGISQARILEWAAISFSRGSSWPRSQTSSSYINRQILYRWATREVLLYSAIVKLHIFKIFYYIHIYVYIYIFGKENIKCSFGLLEVKLQIINASKIIYFKEGFFVCLLVSMWEWKRIKND